MNQEQVQKIKETEAEEQKTTKENKENPMKEIFIEKVVLSCGAKGDDLEKARKLLEFISGMKPQLIASRKRIPDFSVRPGLQVGTRVTVRTSKALDLLKQLLGALNNTLYEDQVSDNHFSFGIPEYIEIPGIEYQREIGIRGLNVTVNFARPGLHSKRKKIKAGKIPKKHQVSQEEIIKFMEENFKTKFN